MLYKTVQFLNFYSTLILWAKKTEMITFKFVTIIPSVSKKSSKSWREKISSDYPNTDTKLQIK